MNRVFIGTYWYTTARFNAHLIHKAYYLYRNQIHREHPPRYWSRSNSINRNLTRVNQPIVDMVHERREERKKDLITVVNHGGRRRCRRRRRRRRQPPPRYEPVSPAPAGACARVHLRAGCNRCTGHESSRPGGAVHVCTVTEQSRTYRPITQSNVTKNGKKRGR